MVTFSTINFLRIAALALLLIGAITVFASRPQGQEPRESDKPILPESYLPDGQGRDLILQSCVQCHDLRNTVSQRKTAAGWKRTVDEMIWRGAPLMVDEAETVTKYLASPFGTDKPVPDELKAKPPSKKQ